MKRVRLGQSDLEVGAICLGTMTFGEQVDQADAFAILDRALELGVDFIDTAEVYSVPTRAETFNITETIIGNWLAARPQAREKIILATKVAGPSRGMPWVRGGSPDLTAADIVAACEGSLRRLQTDVIDLYQLHWPTRTVPMFGGIYYRPSDKPEGTSMHAQLQALASLVSAGKVRAVGLSNETPYGVHEFIRLAEQHGLPRMATVQNGFSLLNRSVENGLDETMQRLEVSLLAYSPLAFGLLTGKYDDSGLVGPNAPAAGRLTRYESTRKQRWGRAEALVAARRYNALARDNGLTPTQMALAFCYTKWQVASTIIGVTTVAQLEEDVAFWGTTLSEDVLRDIDQIRWEMRDPVI